MFIGGNFGAKYNLMFSEPTWFEGLDKSLLQGRGALTDGCRLGECNQTRRHPSRS
jgi:hypothetical protein